MCNWWSFKSLWDIMVKAESEGDGFGPGMTTSEQET